jgi:hypothetical protein
MRRYIEADGGVFQAYPALEGLRGSELREAPAYPSASEESQLMMECANVKLHRDHADN